MIFFTCNYFGKNKPTRTGRKKNWWFLFCFVFFLFRFYLSLLYRTRLTCIGQKRHKNSLNNRPIKTITEHLIERTNHKIQCSKRTLGSLTDRHTFVASWLTLNFSILMSVRGLRTATPPVPLGSADSAPLYPTCTQIPVSPLAVCLKLLSKKSWSPVSVNFSHRRSSCSSTVGGRGGGLLFVGTNAALLHLCALWGPSWCLFSQVKWFFNVGSRLICHLWTCQEEFA